MAARPKKKAKKSKSKKKAKKAAPKKKKVARALQPEEESRSENEEESRAEEGLAAKKKSAPKKAAPQEAAPKKPAAPKPARGPTPAAPPAPVRSSRAPGPITYRPFSPPGETEIRMTTRPKKKKKAAKAAKKSAKKKGGQKSRGQEGKAKKTLKARGKKIGASPHRPRRKDIQLRRSGGAPRERRAAQRLGPPRQVHSRAVGRPAAVLTARPRNRKQDGVAPRVDGVKMEAPLGSPLHRGAHPGGAALSCRPASRVRGGARPILAARAEQQERYDAGELPDFRPGAKVTRDDEDWRVRRSRRTWLDRRVEITGPVDRKMIINALNCGANVFMADFEDANSPTSPTTSKARST